MEIIESDKTKFSVKNKDGSVNSEFVFIFSRPRYGKTLAVESLLELYHKAGYTILCLSDVKGEWELAYSMFKPEKKYHLNRLRKDGTEPSKKDVILYHPMTFNLPNKKLPQMRLYGFSFKELRRAEYSMISETAWESDTTRILLNASSNISSKVGLWGFLHYIKEGIVGKKEGKAIKHDPNLFDLPITSGTAKSLQDIASYFLPFRKNYFLVPDDSDLKLDWGKILNDNKHYHVFGSSYLDDEKLKEFCVLGLLEAIIRNRKKGKRPVLIYIPEIRYLVPYRPEGYKKFLASAIKSKISIMGNMGKGGISGIFDSQSITDTDEDVRKSQTKTFFGELSDRDLDYVTKTFRWKKDDMAPLIKSDVRRTSQPSFLYAGDVESGSWSPRFPSHCHAEESYDFDEMYKKYYPEKMTSYALLLEKEKKRINEERDMIKQKIKKEIDKKKQEEKKKKEEREMRRLGNKSPNIPEKIKEKLSETKKRDMELAHNMYIDENVPKKERSIRKIAEKMNISKSTIAKYIKDYKNIENDELSNIQIEKVEPWEEKNV